MLKAPLDDLSGLCDLIKKWYYKYLHIVKHCGYGNSLKPICYF